MVNLSSVEGPRMIGLGQRIRAARRRRELTVEDAARACHVTVATWYRWEQDRITPTLDHLERIAAGLHTTVSALTRLAAIK